MTNHLSVLLLLVLALATHPASAFADDEPAPTLREAITEGTVSLAVRWRFEAVDQASFDKDAQASTLRTALGYRTQAYRGWSLFLEAENVTEVGFEDRFANRGAGDLGNGVTGRPVIADVAGTEVEKAYLRFERGETRVQVGRQPFAVGDQRFFGTVAWRQNHQSLDAVTVVDRSLDRTTITYGYLDRVNRIFGDGLPMQSHVLHAAISLPAEITLSVYGFLLDFDRSAQAALSTETFGLELRGERAFGNHRLRYELEAAEQGDAGDNPNRVDAGYRFLSVGGESAGVTYGFAREELEATRGGRPFATPLATLHKYNGWADLFLVTPADGLVDTKVSVGGKPGPFVWQVAYHDFEASSGSRDFGTEIDVSLTYKSRWGQIFGIKAASYDADAFGSDTDKIWLWTQHAF